MASKNQNQKIVKDVSSSFYQIENEKKSGITTTNLDDFKVTSKCRNVHLRLRPEAQTNSKDKFSQTEEFIFSSLLAEKQINGIFQPASEIPSSLSCQVSFIVIFSSDRTSRNDNVCLSVCPSVQGKVV